MAVQDSVTWSPHFIPPAPFFKPHYFYRSARHTGLDFVRPELDSFNQVEVEEAHIYPRHQHLNYQLIFAKRGHYRCLLNDIPLALRPRDLLIVKRGDWHEDICARGLHYLAINFDLPSNGSARAEDILFSPDVTPGQQVIRGPNQDIWRLLERMQAEARRADHVVAHLENALLLELFWSLVRALPQERLSPIFLQQTAARAFSQRLRRLFDQHLTEGLSSAAIAAELGVSVRTLTKHCQAVVGHPPGRAFTHYKMDCAARMLRQSKIPIKEISHRLGFRNQYHFSRVFRRYLGTPPSSYRLVPK